MRKTRLALGACALFAASTAFADGAVMGPSFLTTGPRRGPEQVPVDPVIPDQRALIVHRDGRETLVVETAFRGAGTEFAWVLPTPSVPRISEARTDLFERLDAATRPALISETPDLGIVGAVVVAGFVLSRHGGRRGRRAAKALVAGALAIACFGGPATSHAGVVTAGVNGVSLPMTPKEEQVSVRAREVVGAFETVTISAGDPRALVRWLQADGYAVPADAERVAAEYVKEGWVFNAMRLRRGADGSAAVRIHPVAFEFASAAPVYPMRLTALNAHPVAVELFVAGPGRAESDGFDVKRCARIDADVRHSDDLDHVVLAAEDAGPLLAGAKSLTRMTRTFPVEAMRADAAIRWTPHETEQRAVFSRAAASATAWNIGALVAIGAFIGLASAASSVGRRRVRASPRRWTTALVVVLALDAGLTFAALAPTVDTRPAAAERR